jgi:hypothetical protein
LSWTPDKEDNGKYYKFSHKAGMAAALRAAVAHTQQHRGLGVWECDADELLAIAAELEGVND